MQDEQPSLTEQGSTRERELLSEYVAARKKKERLEAELSTASVALEAAKNSLVTHLEDCKKDSTGAYDDLGCLRINKPKAVFSVPPDKKDAIYPWVKEIGATSVIKETINHMTLQSLLSERYNANESIPDFVEVVFISQVVYNKPKG